MFVVQKMFLIFWKNVYFFKNVWNFENNCSANKKLFIIFPKFVYSKILKIFQKNSPIFKKCSWMEKYLKIQKLLVTYKIVYALIKCSLIQEMIKHFKKYSLNKIKFSLNQKNVAEFQKKMPPISEKMFVNSRVCRFKKIV